MGNSFAVSATFIALAVVDRVQRWKYLSKSAITLKFPWEDGQSQDASPAALRIECRPMIIFDCRLVSKFL